jgi:glycosyltransferase involved in cell wall biosynthesis
MEGKRRQMKPLRTFIWQSSIEHHEYYTWLSLQDLMREGEKVTFVLGQVENDIRKAQGWRAVDLTKLDVIFIPSEKLWVDGKNLIEANPDAIHVFLAFRGTKKGYDFFPLILYALLKRIKVAVINEPYSISPVGYFDDDHPLRSQFNAWVRPHLYRLIALLVKLLAGSEKPCIFPVSLIAKEQFRKAGFDPASMFPFGWFVPVLNQPQAPSRGDFGLHIIYLGAMNKRKGVDILLAAVKSVQAQRYNVYLDLYGSTDGGKYEAFDSSICFRGRLPFETVQATLQNYDVLIIPSRHDGWGVVVNEALLQGVPVIASSRVGAKRLLESSGAGLVFESENVKDLAEKIKELVDQPEVLAGLKRNAAQVGQLILPEHGARYFLDVLKYHFYQIGPRPYAVWSETPFQELHHE